MAKKRKKRRTSTEYMMVIRVRVPSRFVPRLKISRVFGLDHKNMMRHDLEICNAYYDKAGQPSAMP